MVKDLVCGRSIDQHATDQKREYGGHLYYFCSRRCHGKFREHPQRYVGRAERAVKEHQQHGYGESDLQTEQTEESCR
jgi:YHS domain-containing protein